MPEFALITAFHLWTNVKFMKPSRFEYRAPETLDEAVALLVGNPGAKPIAGGQSLMPILAFRLASPDLLVDLRRIPRLDAIVIDSDGLRLGAKVRWRDIESDPRLVSAHPLLRASIEHVAHYQIRNRGTVGGSLAHADPAAELPGIAVTCDGEITIVGAQGQRTVWAAEFFTGPLTTQLRSDELITELRLPPGRQPAAGALQNSRDAKEISRWPASSSTTTKTSRAGHAIRISASSARAADRIA